VASRLSEVAGLRVALMEARPDYPSADVLPDDLRYGNATAAYVTTHSHIWGYRARTAVGQELRPLPRGKVAGGTSAINGQVFLRALGDDFRMWAEEGNDRWTFEKAQATAQLTTRAADRGDPAAPRTHTDGQARRFACRSQ
jgi:choline dehydrogenase